MARAYVAGVHNIWRGCETSRAALESGGRTPWYLAMSNDIAKERVRTALRGARLDV
jgi:hypothetical protein